MVVGTVEGWFVFPAVSILPKGSSFLLSSIKEGDELSTSSTRTTEISVPLNGEQQQHYEIANHHHRLFYDDDGDEDKEVFDAGWLQRMLNFLASEKDSIFAGNQVAVIMSSFSSSECLRIVSTLSYIASEADKLFFVVSSQEEDNNNNNIPRKRRQQQEISITNLVNNCCYSNKTISNNNMELVESVEFDDPVVDTKAINVVVVSTKSWHIVQGDPFVNDFLRRTDAWILMDSKFEDNFCYHSRVQEGANITLW